MRPARPSRVRAFRVVARAGYAANGDRPHPDRRDRRSSSPSAAAARPTRPGRSKPSPRRRSGSSPCGSSRSRCSRSARTTRSTASWRGAATPPRKWGRRIAEWGQALVFIALGLIAASVALGARPDADAVRAEDASRGILSIPGGPFVLGLIGIGHRDRRHRVHRDGRAAQLREARWTSRPERFGDGVKGLGIVGFIAKGVALIILGVLLVVAAVKVEPSAAGGLDAAIDALLALAYGPVARRRGRRRASSPTASSASSAHGTPDSDAHPLSTPFGVRRGRGEPGVMTDDTMTRERCSRTAEGTRRRHRFHDADDTGCRWQPRQPPDEHARDGRERRHLVLPGRRLQEGRTKPRPTAMWGCRTPTRRGCGSSRSPAARASSTTGRRWRSSTPPRSTSGSRTGSTLPTSRCCG